ncbi:MAG: methyltransferase domain-containing protein [Alphaproteobacteria bacterium]|nr:methyltransferase domain-containing protein [Alphaproteobacteria bacterium]
MARARNFTPRSLVLAVIGALVLIGAGVFAWSKVDSRGFTPEVGQPGKDVIWVPTPDALVTEMLKAAKVGPQDIVVDLGSGDGKIPIAAARQFGAKARGIEYNPDMVALSRRNAVAAGVQDQVTFVRGDIFKERFDDATVVTMYLLPRLNERLKPTILSLKPGTRVVSNSFDMGDWRPDATIDAGGSRAFFWIVPAKVAGIWTIPLTTEELVRVELVQTYQQVSGTATIAGRPSPIADGVVRGPDVTFTIQDWRGGAWRVSGKVEGDVFKGGVMRVGGDVERMIEVTRGK